MKRRLAVLAGLATAATPSAWPQGHARPPEDSSSPAGSSQGGAPPWGRAQVADAQPVVDWPAVPLLDGSTLAPSAWQDRAAVVVFWATYCAYCRRHNAHIDKLHRTLPGQALRVLGVALDQDANRVRQYMASNGYGFAVTLDQGRLRQRFTSRRVIPMTCVVNRQGRLLQAIPGEMAEDDVMDLARLAQQAGKA